MSTTKPSKYKLCAWVSTVLDMEFTSVHQASTGAVFCQLLDSVHPGSMEIINVNWKAKNEKEYLENFIIFQKGLVYNNIEIPINITRLIKGNYQEILALLHWLYEYYFSKNNYSSIYKALEIRGGQNLIYEVKDDVFLDINIFNKNDSIEKNFYLSKLQDIEYLFFNTEIKDNNDKKIILLKKILESNKYTQIKINEKGAAYLEGEEIIINNENNIKNNFNKENNEEEEIKIINIDLKKNNNNMILNENENKINEEEKIKKNDEKGKKKKKKNQFLSETKEKFINQIIEEVTNKNYEDKK